MCNDDTPIPSRREFLGGTAAVAGAALLIPRRVPPPRRLPLTSPARLTASDGSSAYSMAMHIHSSASEQSASVEAHLYQAQLNSVDVAWFSDHDSRMDAIGYRDVVHFTSLTDEPGGHGQGGPWHWEQQESGPLSSTGSGGGIVSSPITPNDPDPHGALWVSAQSTSTTAASFGYFANCKTGGWNYHCNLNGQTISLDILLNSGWSHGYLEVAIGTSLHEPSEGRPQPGIPVLSYQFHPRHGSQSYVQQGNTGVIIVPLKGPSGPVQLTPASDGSGWVTVALTPSGDIQQLWPDMDYRDFASSAITLSAVSTGDAVSGYFDYMNFSRTILGGEMLAQQESIGADLASTYPDVTQYFGLEVSRNHPHVNWFAPAGSKITVPSYEGVYETEKSYLKYITKKVLPQIHPAGGLYSYNHPYGAKGGPLASEAKQDALLQQVATAMLPTAALGADILEVGYQIRGYCNLAHHLGLWDVMSRNAIFLTGNGTTDDHYASNWAGRVGSNNWVTNAWAASTSTSHLLAALAAGRAWCGDLIAFGAPGTSLDMLVDGSVPMGAVSVESRVTSRNLALTVTGIPTGGSVTLLQGSVDYAGTAQPTPNTTAIGSWTAAEVAAGGGTVTQAVDTSSDSFVRAIVIYKNNKTVVGAGNPIWLLRKQPPNGVPAPRQA